jgi:dolichol-phosphate mannosyltransferase
MNALVRLLLGLEARDCTSGYRAYSAKALKTIDIAKVQSDGYAFQVEMTMLCQQAGLRILEVPIAFLDRRRGESKLSNKERWRFLKSVLRLALSR